MTAGFIAAALYALHQDVWFWRDARPLVFGILENAAFYRRERRDFFAFSSPQSRRSRRLTVFVTGSEGLRYLLV
jgi:hypothetical protein